MEHTLYKLQVGL